MIKTIVYLFLVIIIIIFITNKILKINNFMNIYELIEFNYKLILISNSGLTYIKRTGAKILDIFTVDPLLIKMNRRLQKKYGKYINTYIVTKTKTYYILDAQLARKILQDSPKLFSAGKIKEDFFKSIMPKNVGISKCQTKSKCPWKKRRQFNENVLGTNKFSNFFNCIPQIIKKHIKHPLLSIDDFIDIGFKIVGEMIYGTDNVAKMLQTFTNKANSGKLLKTNFYKQYIQHLHDNYSKSPMCSLLYYANMYKNDKIDVIDDQIPHWFAPFIFMINFLIPNLICVILNFKDIYQKIKTEINDKNFDLFSKKTYLHFCVIEHIRLFNTININIQRTVEKNIKYEGIDFKKNDQIFILFSNILRDSQYFDKPDNFIPDRWIKMSTKEQDIVFGVGPQSCPSRQISPIFYKSVVYHLLKNYNYNISEPKLKTNKLYFINPYQIKFSIL